jgi:gamma-glutamylcyclotransferase (GGCT)/AIG2-like uncharacterized protein YtfP
VASVRLFVYGSLKREGQHHEELRGARFLAEVLTAPGFRLVTLELGPASYSALVRAPSSPSAVPGELFEVPEEELPALDAFEGPEYERGEVALSAEAAARGASALAYFIKSG